MKEPIVFEGVLAKSLGIENAIMIQLLHQTGQQTNIDSISCSFWNKTTKQKIIKELKKLNIVVVENGKISLEFSVLNKYLREERSIKTESSSVLPVLTNNYHEDFEKLWEYYNFNKSNKGSKKAAYEKWLKSNIRKIPVKIIEKIIDLYRNSMEDVKFMKHLSTFISQAIYENHAPDRVTITDQQGINWNGYLFPDNVFFAIDGDNVYKTQYTRTHIENMKKQGRIRWYK